MNLKLTLARAAFLSEGFEKPNTNHTAWILHFINSQSPPTLHIGMGIYESVPFDCLKDGKNNSANLLFLSLVSVFFFWVSQVTSELYRI